jgi:mannose-6-phosphate isomerase class I
VIVVLDGSGQIHAEGGAVPIRAGQTFISPYAAGPLTIDGMIDLIVCLPPDVSQ